MSDHKPECPMLDEQWPKHPLEKCPYCDMLRACEQRTLDAAREAVAAVEDQWDAEIDYDRDYAFDPSGGTRNPRIWLRDALAAIDALRQEKK